MPAPRTGLSMLHALATVVVVWASPAFASVGKTGSCESIPAEALLALFALIFALRPISEKRR